MLTDTATAFERATGEVPRTLMDMATLPNFEEFNIKLPGLLFVNSLKDYLRDNLQWLHFVNSGRVRKDLGHKLVAASKKRSTESDFQVNDVVSYNGKAVKITELHHRSAHGWAKATVRSVSHDSVNSDTVNYSDLLPIGTARPELMSIEPIDFADGNLAFFSDEKDKVSAGVVVTSAGPMLTIHLHQQAQKQERKFTPLYKLKSGAVEPKEKPPASAAAVVKQVSRDKVIATTPLCKFRVTDQGQLSALGE